MNGLDLFCGAGGAGVGYARAGHTITGVDINPQPNYPHTFWRMDALELLKRLLNGERFALKGQPAQGLDSFNFIHASPPCQGYTALKAVHGNPWPLLIEPVRELLQQTGLPYIIENVQGAPIRRDLTLCGEMFGLSVIRHRYFELGRWSAVAPAHVPHRGRVAGWRHGQYFDGPYFAVHGEGGGKGTVAQWREAMGIDWTWDRHEIAEAIPPAYTEWIGERL
jgi:DNA (cytosine-5)-methyltransferase 1